MEDVWICQHLELVQLENGKILKVDLSLIKAKTYGNAMHIAEKMADSAFDVKVAPLSTRLEELLKHLQREGDAIHLGI